MPEADEQALISQAAQAAVRLISGLERDAAELAQAGAVAEKEQGQAALAAATSAARRVLQELEEIRE